MQWTVNAFAVYTDHVVHGTIFGSDPTRNDPAKCTIDVFPGVFTRQGERYATAGKCAKSNCPALCGVIDTLNGERDVEAQGRGRWTRRRRQLQTRSSLLLLRSVILGNGDGLRVETNARSGNVFFCSPNPFSQNLSVYSPSLHFLLLSAHPFARLKHLVLQYVRSYMYSTDTFLFFFTFYFFYFYFPAPPFCSCAPEFAVCPCFIASYLSTLYVYYIPPGAWCATKLL